MSTPQQLLTQLLTPILEPLIQFQREARHLTSIHHDAVYKFRLVANSLTLPGTDLLKGEAAKAFDSIMNEYLSSEARFTGAGTAMNAGCMEEAAVACAILEQQIVQITWEKGLELLGDVIGDMILAAVAAFVDITAVLQGCLDIPYDEAAVLLDAWEAARAFEFKVKIAEFLAAILDAERSWQYKIQHLADQPLPSLPPTPISASEPILLFPSSHPVTIPIPVPTPTK